MFSHTLQLLELHVYTSFYHIRKYFLNADFKKAILSNTVVLATTERAIFLLLLPLHSPLCPQNPQWDQCMLKCGVVYKAQTQNKQQQRKKGSEDLFEEREIIKPLALQFRDAATGIGAAT